MPEAIQAAPSTDKKTSGRTLDRTRYFVTVHGREEAPDPGKGEGQARPQAYMQDGRYFDDQDNEIEGALAAGKIEGEGRRAKIVAPFPDAEARRRAEEDAREIKHRSELQAGVGRR